MIPDYLIDRAWRAYTWANNTQAIRNELAHPDLRGPMPPPPDPRLSMRTALEVVAADIWHEGYAAAEWNAEEVCKCAAWNEGECGCGNYGNGHRIKRNPYKEAA